MFEVSHQYGKFICRSTRGQVYEEYTYDDRIVGSMDNARKRADDWAERMNKLWNRKAA